MTDERSLVPAQQPALATVILDGASSQDIIQVIRQREQALHMCREVAIRTSNPRNWKDFGGKMWPEAPAVAKMMHTFGVSIYDEHQEWEDGLDEEGPWYLCRYRATFSVMSLGLGPIVATGTAQSRDSFLSATRIGPDLRACVLKKAEVNCRARGVMALLGIDLTREDMAQYWGQERTQQVGEVKFNQGGRGGGTSQTMIIPFGQDRGKKICDASNDNLNWLTNAVAKSVNDPGKAKWRDKNQQLLDAINGELWARNGGNQEQKAQEEPTETEDDFNFGHPPIDDGDEVPFQEF